MIAELLVLPVVSKKRAVLHSYNVQHTAQSFSHRDYKQPERADAMSTWSTCHKKKLQSVDMVSSCGILHCMILLIRNDVGSQLEQQKFTFLPLYCRFHNFMSIVISPSHSRRCTVLCRLCCKYVAIFVYAFWSATL